jgi:hypothetical protein
MDTRHWPLPTTVNLIAQVDRLQRDVWAHQRPLSGEEQNHIEVLTGKRLQPRPLPPREEVAPVAPVLQSLDPPTAALGTPSFTLHVHGVGFAPDDVILWNGGAEATTFVSPTEVTTGVNMDTAAYAVPIPVEVAGAGGVSNALTFTFTEPA